MILVVALLALCSSLFAQTNVRAEADSLFRIGDYERVELVVLRAARQTDLTAPDKIALELLGGYALIMLNREADARAHFEQAIDLDSTLVLDPVQVSPKFRVVFDDVKQEWLTKRTRSIPTSQIREVTTYQHARSESHLLNLALPGAGFVREGKTVRGLIHFAAQATFTILWLSELSQNNSARKDYLAAASSASASSLYNTYDTHHRRMWTYGLTAAGIYLASQVDLALWRTPTTSFEVLPAELGARIQLNF